MGGIIMKRTLLIIILLLIIAVMVLVWAWPAQAVTYSGGTPEHQHLAREIIESCRLDYQWIDARVEEVDVLFAEEYDPYWEFCDPLEDIAGVAWWGNIVIDSHYAPRLGSFFTEIVTHEWCHQIWFGMPLSWRLEWGMLCTEGIDYWDSTQWLQMPAENFAECMRLALFDSRYQYHPWARTQLKVVPPAEAWQFLLIFRWGTENRFTDLDNEDYELKAAAGYLFYHGILQGYLDGTLGPYQPLLRRHVALICERAGLECALSVYDYTPATRADVRDGIPGLTWLEERWEEGITRGQLARLIWRSNL